MGTENPGRPTYPGRPATTPFGAPPPNIRPLSSTPPISGSAFRPTMPPLSQSNLPSASSDTMASTEAPGFQVRPPSTFSNPSVAPTPGATSYVTQTPGVTTFQRFSAPQCSSAPQAPPQHPPTMGQAPLGAPPAGQVSSPPPSFRPIGNVPAVPMGQPTQKATFPPPSGNVPQMPSDSLSTFPRPKFQQSFPALDSSIPAVRPTVPLPFSVHANQQPNVPLPAPLSQSSLATHPAGYVPAPPVPSPFQTHQVGYVQPPPGTVPLGVPPRDLMQHSVSGPPSNAMYGLMEAFNSLSIGSVPGSLDPGVDFKALPRPLDGDVEPISFSEMFPLNCHSCYLRLTTSAIPSSQSLISRWNLPLGAVVCPLAEAPEGVSTAELNMIFSCSHKINLCLEAMVLVESSMKVLHVLLLSMELADDMVLL